MMINILLTLVLIFEIIRLILYIQDSRRIRKQNELAAENRDKWQEFEKKNTEDWKQLRQMEIAELKELAKASDTMKEIYDEWVSNHKELG